MLIQADPHHPEGPSILAPFVGLCRLSGWAQEGDPHLKNPSLLAEQRHREGKDGRLMAAVLNGRRWVFFEDPCDGYRSVMDTKAWCDHGTVLTRFPEVTLLARWADESRWACADPKAPERSLMEWVCPETQELVMRLGTERADDWYPSAIMQVEPEALQAVLARQSAQQLAQSLGEAPAAKGRRPRL